MPKNFDAVPHYPEQLSVAPLARVGRQVRCVRRLALHDGPRTPTRRAEERRAHLREMAGRADYLARSMIVSGVRTAVWVRNELPITLWRNQLLIN